MTTETAVRERPILFNSAMVRAVLAGRKTQTRRVIKRHPGYTSKCPYGVAGDRLWVREGFCRMAGLSETWYRADCNGKEVIKFSWKPSIHMPRKYCRILLEVKSVRVERVQDITPSDAVAEGVTHQLACSEFKFLWNSINAKRGFGWDVNPWVWVVEFERIDE